MEVFFTKDNTYVILKTILQSCLFYKEQVKLSPFGQVPMERTVRSAAAQKLLHWTTLRKQRLPYVRPLVPHTGSYLPSHSVLQVRSAEIKEIYDKPGSTIS